MNSKNLSAVIILGSILVACDPDQAKQDKIFEIYNEKYPNLYDPFTRADQSSESPFQYYEAGNSQIALNGFDSILQIDSKQIQQANYESVS